LNVPTVANALIHNAMPPNGGLPRTESLFIDQSFPFSVPSNSKKHVSRSEYITMRERMREPSITGTVTTVHIVLVSDPCQPADCIMMKSGMRIFNVLLMAFSGMCGANHAIAQNEISGFASVQQDGSLKLSGTLVHLYGIYIPPTDQTCYTFIRPPPCGTRASLALDFRISGDFVHCIPRATNGDGSIVASCSVENEDLSAWMLQRGWAVATPDAPFEYTTMERIAQSKGIGIWGIPVQIIPRRK
jgi:endonuclease YncB( thermonuclease family)